MILNVYAAVFYLTDIDGITWRQQDYDSNKIIKCIKGEGFAGYFDLSVGGAPKRFEAHQQEDVATRFCVAAAKKLSPSVNGDFVIVPVPNSTAVVSDKAEFRTLNLARQIAASVGSRATAVDALRWNAAKLSSRKGGTRDPQVLIDNLRLCKNLDQPVILFDDVMTSGAHIVASYRKLTASRVQVPLGIVIGRATHEQKPKMLGWVTHNVPVGTESSDFDIDRL